MPGSNNSAIHHDLLNIDVKNVQITNWFLNIINHVVQNTTQA